MREREREQIAIFKKKYITHDLSYGSRHFQKREIMKRIVESLKVFVEHVRKITYVETAFNPAALIFFKRSLQYCLGVRK